MWAVGRGRIILVRGLGPRGWLFKWYPPPHQRQPPHYAFTTQPTASGFLQNLSPALYKTVITALQHHRSRYETQVATLHTFWTPGPSFQYDYQWHTNQNNALVWQRRPTFTATPTNSNMDQNIQILAHIPTNRNRVLCSSVSHDEACYGYAVAQGTSDESSPQAVVVYVTTQQQTWTDAGPGGSVLQMEFWGSYVYLVTADASHNNNRPCQVYRAPIDHHHTSPPEWQRVYACAITTNDDDHHVPFLHLYRTKNGRALVLQVQRLAGTQLLIVQEEEDMEDHHHDLFREVGPFVLGRSYIWDQGGSTDDGLMGVHDATVGHVWWSTTSSTNATMPPLHTSTNDRDLNSTHRQVVLSTATGYRMMEVDMTRYWYIVYEVATWGDGRPQLRVIDRRRPGDDWVVVDLPMDAGSNYRPLYTTPYESSMTHVVVESPVSPPAVYQINFITRRVTRVIPPTPSSKNDNHHSTSDYIDHSDDQHPYELQRVGVTSRDGTLIPLSLWQRRDYLTLADTTSTTDTAKATSSGGSDTITIAATSSSSPRVVLTAYGAYGAVEENAYNPLWPVLLDNGYVLAVAHVRGGGALGVPWHAAGQQPQGKQKGVEDLLACAQALSQYLVDPSPTRLAVVASSAGGTLVANAVHQAQHLFDDVVLSNAFLDVYHTLREDTPLSRHEWDEFGNPSESEESATLLRAYCPVQTAETVGQNVPRMLLLAAKQDQVVPYAQTTKYAERLRHHLSPQEADKVTVWLEDDVGHDFGHKRLHAVALQAAFLLVADNN